jgi:transposase
MLNESKEVEYRTVQIGAAPVVKGMLERLGVVAAIDQALDYQPAIAASYGQLAQAVIINRMSFAPQPLYGLSVWAAEHGIDHLLGLEAKWLDDDRLGAMLEGLADHQVAIWGAIMAQAVQVFPLELEWLHADTTSVYFEGAYEDENGEAKQEANAPLLLQGYNKDGKAQNVQFVLSLVTSKRVPLWYKPWDGNQSDDGVYLADLRALRQLGFTPANAVLIGDRKLCNRETLLQFCRSRQLFLAAHPWTETAKRAWLQTWQELQAAPGGQVRRWEPAAYTSRNQASKPAAERTQYQVCEIEHDLWDEEISQPHVLRWVFCWSSDKAQQDARQRQRALSKGEQALQRIAALLGRYDYKTHTVIHSRIDKALHKANAHRYFHYTLTGSEQDQTWHLAWQPQQAVLTEQACFDGVMLLCTNVPRTRLSTPAVMLKYKEQVNVEQTIDFLKSPVQIRPLWLHSPKRLAGLTLLIMIAVLLAALLEYQVRLHIAQTGQLLEGLMPEKRDNPYPTATKLLRTFQDYALVLVQHPDGQVEIHQPKFRPVQQQIWDILQTVLRPVPTLDSG